MRKNTTAPAAGDAGDRKKISDETEHLLSQNANASKAVVRAEIVGSDRCSALGVTATAHAPVLSLCRKLVEALQDPSVPLHAYRGGTLCLTVRSIGGGAALTVSETQGTRFAPWKPFPSFAVSPRIAPKRRGAS